MKQLIYKPTQNRKTHEIILNILKNIDSDGQGRSINIVFTDNLCMLGAQTSDRIIKEVDGFRVYETDDNKSISINCESSDIEGVSRKQIDTHVLGLIIHEGVRNIITLTNSVRLPQMKNIIDLLVNKDSLGRPGIVPTNIPIINLYFDEADKTIRSITRELESILSHDYIKDFYITATPKKILKLYGKMELYPVQNTLDSYINLQYANWIDIGDLDYMDSLREMLNRIKCSDGGTINPKRFIFAPGIITKESHYSIAEESTNVYQCISVIVNSDGLHVLLPYGIKEIYLSSIVNSQNERVPTYPPSMYESFNSRNWNNLVESSGGDKFYKLNFNKKSLINENDNEFWKIIQSVREFWKDNPIIVTGSRCIERGITIQNPNNKMIRFTDGMLHNNISRGDSGAQMAGRFTLTYNDSLKRYDFEPINIYSSEKVKVYMINQEKKAMYAVKLSSEGKDMIEYNEWKNYERESVLGEEVFSTYLEAIHYAKRQFKDHTVKVNENPEYYSETKSRLGSCNRIDEGMYRGFRFNSFDNKDKQPIDNNTFKLRKTRHLRWRKKKTGNPYRIWAVYDTLEDISSLMYHVCYTPIALHNDLDESESDSDL
uniref:Uncharacterized protein n=1 Tax=viral metagenome TaxID=1070528 RepID=A0A6C0L2B6_9ZZZZ|tara:strand:- start:3243 stop:5045 length:1803 start_codon:yes stop_codon:yes gene_type:complete